ncbi:MAG: branched-chain amino acid ABC transporter permease, partial [Chloroflexota bacterium]|nr:branched-chain amino acid ABC transporter permease [Chloroflexota bacterium]
GSGNNKGAILGSFIVWGIWAGSQILPGFLSDPHLRLLMTGVLIVGVMLFKPGGLLGEERRVSNRVT